MTKEQFMNLLNCWIKFDLVHMLSIKSSNGCGGCNFPIVLYTLSCMEWLGFLLRDCTASKTQLDETGKNIDGCLDFFPDNYKDSRIRVIIKSLFRNGLVHQFGPKFSGVSRGRFFDPPVQLMPGSFAPVIDADQLAGEFIKVIDRTLRDLNSDSIDFEKIKEKIEFIFINDRKAFERMIAQFQSLQH